MFEPHGPQLLLDYWGLEGHPFVYVRWEAIPPIRPIKSEKERCYNLENKRYTLNWVKRGGEMK